MSNNKKGKDTGYLDTWAATYAANTNFEQAIELQKLALELRAIKNVMIGIWAHLRFFEAEPTSKSNPIACQLLICLGKCRPTGRAGANKFKSGQLEHCQPAHSDR